MMKKSLYFVRRERYCGTDNTLKYDRAIISTVSGNRGEVDCVCNDYYSENLGECETLAEAREIASESGFSVLIDDEFIQMTQNYYIDRRHYFDRDGFAIEEWATPKSLRVPMEAYRWIYWFESRDGSIVTADMTDEQLLDIEARLENSAADCSEMSCWGYVHGVELNGAWDWLTSHRDKLREERGDLTGEDMPPHKWRVVKLHFFDLEMSLECENCDMAGYVKHPSRQDWNAAIQHYRFPYSWRGNSKVYQFEPEIYRAGRASIETSNISGCSCNDMPADAI